MTVYYSTPKISAKSNSNSFQGMNCPKDETILDFARELFNEGYFAISAEIDGYTWAWFGWNSWVNSILDTEVEDAREMYQK